MEQQHQQDTQAQGSTATTEAWRTLFTHLACSPEVSETHLSQRHFCASYLARNAGKNVNLMRHEDEQNARLSIDTYGTQDVAVSVTTKLTADQCEALGRALLDAAHDLRAHPAADLMLNSILATAEGGAA